MTKKELVFLLICTFLVGMIWLSYDIFFKTKASVKLDPKLETILDPLPPTFDQQAIDIVSTKGSAQTPPPLPKNIPIPENPAITTRVNTLIEPSSTGSSTLSP